MDNTALAVFAGDTWVTAPAAPALRRGVPNGVGSNVLTAVGDGTRVYYSKSLAAIQGGQITAISAPECLLPPEMPIGLRDGQGAFWLPAYWPLPPGGGSPQREYRSIRLGVDGPIEELTNNVWPFLVDRSGNVWLAQMSQTYPYRPRCHLWIWRGGASAQELEIPLAQELRGIFSGKPGSVYVWTSLGLHHLTADSPNGAPPFQVSQAYALPLLNLNDNKATATYSPLLGLVIPTQPRNLTIIPLPTNDRS